MIASRTHTFRWVLKDEVLLAFHCCFLNIISSFSEKTPSHPLLSGSVRFRTGKDYFLDEEARYYKLLYFLISDLLS